jgi:hypothetical protein
MEKPNKICPEPYYSFWDIIRFIEHKYNINTRQYKKEKDGITRDFLQFIVWLNGQPDRRRGFVQVIIPEMVDSTEPIDENQYLRVPVNFNSNQIPGWIKEIGRYIFAEFPDLKTKNEQMSFETVLIEW